MPSGTSLEIVDLSATPDHANGDPEAMATRRLGAYLSALASRTPTPGGGSVTGVVAAVAAALGEMVCSFSDPTGEAGDDLRRVAVALSRQRDRCLELAVVDEGVYAAYRAAAALPRSDESERTARAAALRGALHRATETPLLVAEGCRDLLVSLIVVARAGKASLRSDVEIAVRLLDAALLGALATARGNFDGLDGDARSTFTRRAEMLEQAGATAREEALAALRGEE